MIGVGVAAAGQRHDVISQLLGGGVARPPAIISVGNCCLPILALGGQQTPGAALGNAEHGGGLSEGDLVCQGAFKDVNPGALLLANDESYQ